ncbi:hypothetical protein [Paenibacillus glacialis]|uniref:hypothetical protein n=1 Tax=Paenibacillus glacialis TaxID=494026 RepID=UPI000AA0FF80|nr:hypothetical protein [Paenibacillus glacialis]
MVEFQEVSAELYIDIPIKLTTFRWNMFRFNISLSLTMMDKPGERPVHPNGIGFTESD